MKAPKKFSLLTYSFWLSLCIFIVFIILFDKYVHAEKQINDANELRLQSYLLADELRQSSDDRARMVRSYVLTGNPLYKRHFQEILDILNGKSPRPVNYNFIYWDLVLADDIRPRPYGQQKIALLEMMKQVGFTDVEFTKLEQAKANSDALTSTEFAAMKLVESTATPADANKLKASLMLRDVAYFQAKSDIMRPISEFYQLMDQRTLDAVHAAETVATRMRILFILSGFVLIITLCIFYLHTTRTLQKMAYTDPLTGLFNRRIFLERLTQEVAKIDRLPNYSVALLMLDLDFFKKVNDTYGHASGDAVLKAFAEIVKNNSRTIDVAARLGGEEFAILLTGADKENAHIIAERLREQVAELVIDHDLGSIMITVSIGAVCVMKDDTNTDAVMQRADDALYEAKNRGRNQIYWFH